MSYLPTEMIIEILLYDVSNINKLKLLCKDTNFAIKYYLNNLLYKKNYFTINFKYFENKIFLNNVLNNFFNVNSIQNNISNKINCYTFIYDLIGISYFNINKLMISSNIVEFFEKKCYTYAKISLENNDFNIYETNIKKIKVILSYVNKIRIDNRSIQKPTLDDISKKVYDELKINYSFHTNIL